MGPLNLPAVAGSGRKDIANGFDRRDTSRSGRRGLDYSASVAEPDGWRGVRKSRCNDPGESRQIEGSERTQRMGRGPAQRQLADEAQCESSGKPEIRRRNAAVLIQFRSESGADSGSEGTNRGLSERLSAVPRFGRIWRRRRHRFG